MFWHASKACFDPDRKAPRGRRYTLSLVMASLTVGVAMPARTQPVSNEAAEINRSAPEADASVQRVARVEVTGHYDTSLGASDAASQGSIRSELLRSRPTARVAELLEFVPGLVVTQHSGEGKANQYFLRGFNLDHGTDFATTVDGMPVNMPSHAHGQGYSDLNFLIPELVQRIDYRKGPYFATHGDFAAAGAADVFLARRMLSNLLSVDTGQFGYRRGVFAGSLPMAKGLDTLAALEVVRNNGPWEVSEALRKTNAVLSLAATGDERGGSITAMHYGAKWRATDQVPQRLIDAGEYVGQPFNRFSTLDPSDGGQSRRSSVSWQLYDNGEESLSTVSGYWIRNHLKLFSNFTYALDRPEVGDQFSQREARNVVGLKAEHRWKPKSSWISDTEFTTGVQVRHDRIALGLDDSVGGQITNAVREDRVRQTQSSGFLQAETAWSPLLRSVLGLRYDRLDARVQSLLTPDNSGHSHAQQLSPKVSVVYRLGRHSEGFINAGRGFHSNDARGTTATRDPRSVEAIAKVPGLAAATGYELGLKNDLGGGLRSSLALWRLRFGSELVYVGDAGTTEPGPASRRHGLEWKLDWAPTPWLLVDADLAKSRARHQDGSAVTNSVGTVLALGVSLRKLNGFDASVHWRSIGSAPLDETNTVRSRSSSTVNLRVRKAFTPGFEVQLDVLNALNRRNDDIQYAYTSRLPNEAEPVFDRHVHAAPPRSLRLGMRLQF